MIKESSIFLREEITARDADAIAKWLDDGEVSMYLNEKRGVASSLRELAASDVPAPGILFNRGGKFLMVCDEWDKPIGFVKLIPTPGQTECEIVVVIGERGIWGMGFGSKALAKSLNLAFFEWRARKVTANIHNDNHRSVRVFTRAGFEVEHEYANAKRFGVTLDGYLEPEYKREIS